METLAKNRVRSDRVRGAVCSPLAYIADALVKIRHRRRFCEARLRRGTRGMLNPLKPLWQRWWTEVVAPESVQGQDIDRGWEAEHVAITPLAQA